MSAAFGADGQPTPAALGFAKKQGVAFEQLDAGATRRRANTSRSRSTSAARAPSTRCPICLTGLLRDLSFPKQMHWDARLDDGRGELLFGRPIRWLLFLYGGRVVPFTIGRTPGAAGPLVQDIESGALTYGHRFLATSGRAGRSIKVRSFEEYQARLAEHFVVLDHADRRDRIARDLERHARRLGGRVHLKDHAALVEEVADLVEYPAVIAGFFDARLPRAAARSAVDDAGASPALLPVLTEAGGVKEAFLAVVNTQPVDERLIAKNAERVVAARLRDAKFFWDADRKATLESRLDRLHTVLFHKKLGSYRDKAERIEKLARMDRDRRVRASRRGGRCGQGGSSCEGRPRRATWCSSFRSCRARWAASMPARKGSRRPCGRPSTITTCRLASRRTRRRRRRSSARAATAWAAVSLADKLDTLSSG